MKHIRQIFFLLLLTPFASFSQWTDDPNNPLAICNATGIQKTVHTVGDDNGGHFVFWIDNRDQVTGTAIYGQHVDEDGNLLWSANGKSIYQTAGKEITDFKMVAWQGGILVAWLQRPSGYADSLLAQYFDLDGEPVWSQPVTVATATDGVIAIGSSAAFNIFPNQLGATIAYYLTYTGGSTFGCFNRVDFSGNLTFPNNNFLITQYPYYDYKSCDDHQNGVYVLMKGNGIGSGMVIQRYDADGNSVWPTPVDITANAGGFNGYITMISDAAGALYVVWDSYGSNGIVATKLNPDGSFAWSPTYSDVSDFNSVQSRSSAILVNDKLFVTWDDNRPNANFAYIYVQKIDTSGVIEWTPGGVQASNLNSYIPNPKLITSDSGSIVATYEVSAGFLGQKFRPDSTIKYPQNGDTISVPTNTPFYEDYELQQGTGGCTIAFWANEAGDIYGGRICTEQTNVGVNEIFSDENSISVFPNPSFTGIFQMEAHAHHVSAVRVLDLTGKTILETVPSTTSFTLDLSSFAKGTYFLEARTNETIFTKKLLIQ